MGRMDEVWRVRAVRREEWAAARELRLLALADPAAPVAFTETLEAARRRPDDFWRERTRGVDGPGPNRQFVAETPEGTWAGTVTVVVDEPGAVDYWGEPVEARQASVVGVFVRAEHRGTGAIAALLRAAVAWARALPDVRRVTLIVHRDNPRAEGAYRRAGFVRAAVHGDECAMDHREDPAR